MKVIFYLFNCILEFISCGFGHPSKNLWDALVGLGCLLFIAGIIWAITAIIKKCKKKKKQKEKPKKDFINN